MKSHIHIKLLVAAFFTFFISSSAFSQSIIQGDVSRDREAEARRLVEQWDDKLGLRAKQEMLMEKKFIEFAIKREKLFSLNLPPKEELEQLALLKLEETKDMHDILTKPQYDKYVFLISQEKP